MPATNQAIQKQKSVGGWLIVFYSWWLARIVMTWVVLIGTSDTCFITLDEDSELALPGLRVFAITSTIVVFALQLHSIFVYRWIRTCDRRAPNSVIGNLIACLIAALGLSTWASTVFDTPLLNKLLAYWPTAITALFWIPYFLFSNRVRLTYGGDLHVNENAVAVQSLSTETHLVTNQRDDNGYTRTDVTSPTIVDTTLIQKLGDAPADNTMAGPDTFVAHNELFFDEANDEVGAFFDEVGSSSDAAGEFSSADVSTFSKKDCRNLSSNVHHTDVKSHASIADDTSRLDHVSAGEPASPAASSCCTDSGKTNYQRAPTWIPMLTGSLLFGIGLMIGLDFATGPESINLRDEYDRRLKEHLARYSDDPVSVTVATIDFNSDERLSPFDSKQPYDGNSLLEVAKTLAPKSDRSNEDLPAQNAPLSQNKMPAGDAEGLGSRTAEITLAEEIINSADERIEEAGLDSNLQLSPERVTHALAFTLYELGIEAARKANQTNINESDKWWKSAIELLTTANDIDPGFNAPRIALACIYFYYSNENDAAKQLLSEVVRRAPLNAEGHYYLAAIHYDEGDEEGAIREVNLAIRLDPDFGPSFRLRSRLYEARNELAKAERDFFYFDALTENCKDEDVYPWTLRSVLFRSHKSGLGIKYSSTWYPFQSNTTGSELRLIRHDHARAIAFSVIYLGEVGEQGLKSNKLSSYVVEGFEEEFDGLRECETVRLGSGELSLENRSVYWVDFDINSPPWLAIRSRIFTLEHEGRAWVIRFSTPRDQKLFRQYLPSAEDIIRSISFR